CELRAPECERGPQPTMVAAGQTVRCWRPMIGFKAGNPASVPATTIVPSVDVVLAAEQLTKIFRGRVRALMGVGFELKRKAVLGWVGESGSGKSTLLRCIAGLEEAESGRMSYLGLELPPRLESRPASALKAIQMVFQDPESTLNPALTV